MSKIQIDAKLGVRTGIKRDSYSTIMLCDIQRFLIDDKHFDFKKYEDLDKKYEDLDKKYEDLNKKYEDIIKNLAKKWF
jgi:hypothetical protein